MFKTLLLDDRNNDYRGLYYPMLAGGLEHVLFFHSGNNNPN
jgi:hypothetical protein